MPLRIRSKAASSTYSRGVFLFVCWVLSAREFGSKGDRRLIESPRFLACLAVVFITGSSPDPAITHNSKLQIYMQTRMKLLVTLQRRMSEAKVDLCDCFFILRADCGAIRAVELFPNVQLRVSRDDCDDCAAISLVELFLALSASSHRIASHSAYDARSLIDAKLLHSLLSDTSKITSLFSPTAFFTSRSSRFTNIAAFQSPLNGYKYLGTLGEIKTHIDAGLRGISLQLLSLPRINCECLRVSLPDEIASLSNVFVVEVQAPPSCLCSGEMPSQVGEIPQLYIAASQQPLPILYTPRSHQTKLLRRSAGAQEQLRLQRQITASASVQEAEAAASESSAYNARMQAQNLQTALYQTVAQRGACYLTQASPVTDASQRLDSVSFSENAQPSFIPAQSNPSSSTSSLSGYGSLPERPAEAWEGSFADSPNHSDEFSFAYASYIQYLHRFASLASPQPDSSLNYSQPSFDSNLQHPDLYATQRSFDSSSYSTPYNQQTAQPNFDPNSRNSNQYTAQPNAYNPDQRTAQPNPDPNSQYTAQPDAYNPNQHTTQPNPNPNSRYTAQPDAYNPNQHTTQPNPNPNSQYTAQPDAYNPNQHTTQPNPDPNSQYTAQPDAYNPNQHTTQPNPDPNSQYTAQPDAYNPNQHTTQPNPDPNSQYTAQPDAYNPNQHTAQPNSHNSNQYTTQLSSDSNIYYSDQASPDSDSDFTSPQPADYATQF
ncbi:hypothetical protein VKT23_004873 [Stygiomarasmius scandens]|uniref:Uncharacterized protein n=1 Tax=Marasmiellus scandens TaxID=2682957 RepID=A0ABR1JRG9_9AGAR